MLLLALQTLKKIAFMKYFKEGILVHLGEKLANIWIFGYQKKIGATPLEYIYMLQKSI